VLHHTTQAGSARAEPQPPAAPPPGDRFVRHLYDQYGGQLLRVTRRRTGDHQLAEDIVQETFLRAWRHGASLSADKGSIGCWLSTVARNLVIDHARRRSVRPTETIVEPETAGARAMVTDDLADTVVNSISLIDALCSLNAKHRDVLVETFLNDRTAAEAGMALGVPAGTVRSRRFQALRVLRTAMDQTSDALGVAA
jgi:RNA polymerase sigma-70 factor (ECF subfamily)